MDPHLVVPTITASGQSAGPEAHIDAPAMYPGLLPRASLSKRETEVCAAGCASRAARGRNSECRLWCGHQNREVREPLAGQLFLLAPGKVGTGLPVTGSGQEKRYPH
ncbi:MAG TPA: hypothetical protein VGF67_02835 [Ktedonobacteraceae bacterium]|jgi:hypothetical protein